MNPPKVDIGNHYGEYYVFFEDIRQYLHADGKLRKTTRYDKQYTGLFPTEDVARFAYTRWLEASGIRPS